jgi:hypothetical protein
VGRQEAGPVLNKSVVGPAECRADLRTCHICSLGNIGVVLCCDLACLEATSRVRLFNAEVTTVRTQITIMAGFIGHI